MDKQAFKAMASGLILAVLGTVTLFALHEIVRPQHTATVLYFNKSLPLWVYLLELLFFVQIANFLLSFLPPLSIKIFCSMLFIGVCIVVGPYFYAMPVLNSDGVILFGYYNRTYPNTDLLFSKSIILHYIAWSLQVWCIFRYFCRSDSNSNWLHNTMAAIIGFMTIGWSIIFYSSVAGFGYSKLTLLLIFAMLVLTIMTCRFFLKKSTEPIFILLIFCLLGLFFLLSLCFLQWAS